MMMCIPLVSSLSFLSAEHLMVLSIKHDMRGIMGNERRGNLEALHVKVIGKAEAGEASSLLSSCGFYQVEFCFTWPC